MTDSNSETKRERSDEHECEVREWQIEKNYDHRHISGPNTVGEHGELKRVTVVEYSREGIKQIQNAYVKRLQDVQDLLSDVKALTYALNIVTDERESLKARLAESERLKQYVPSEKSDKEIARENAHLKSEVRRLQNSIDKLRLDMSASDARSDNWRKERDDALAKLNEAKDALEKFLDDKYFLTCDLNDCPDNIRSLRECLERLK